MSITVSKLPRPVHEGDWHDKPLRWVVEGPGTERQMFATKRNAEAYKRIRSKVSSQGDAIKDYAFV